MSINLQRTIEMRSRLNPAFAVVLHFPAPENCLAFFIRGLQLEPHIESVHRTAREEVSDLARAHHHIHANVISTPHGRVGAIDGSGDRPNFSRRTFRQRNIRFFANRESRREFRLSHFASRRRARFFARWRNRENIHAELFVLQKALGELILRLVLIRNRNRRVRTGKTMRMH